MKEYTLKIFKIILIEVSFIYVDSLSISQFLRSFIKTKIILIILYLSISNLQILKYSKNMPRVFIHLIIPVLIQYI